jgi:hypothetical protein
MLTVSFYYPVSLFIASPLIVPSLKKVDLRRAALLVSLLIPTVSGLLDGYCCDGTRWIFFGLNGYAPRWASYGDAFVTVAGCAPCAFFPISAFFNPFLVASLCCCLHTLTYVDPFEEFGAFRVADFLSVFKCVSPDDTEC